MVLLVAILDSDDVRGKNLHISLRRTSLLFSQRVDILGHGDTTIIICHLAAVPLLVAGP
jgi:hypothetical protein